MLWIASKIFPDFKSYLDTQNIAYGILSDKSLKPPRDETIPIISLDFQNPETLGHQIEQATDPKNISAVLVAGYENYVFAAAHITEHFGLPGLSIEAAKAASDKVVMRKAFSRGCPWLTPDFTNVVDWEDIEDFMSSHDYPVMLKPANLMKSLLVTKNQTESDLHHNFQTLKSELESTYKKYQVVGRPRVVLEEFLEGSMHTVAGFVDQHGEPQLVPYITDCQTAQDIGRDDTYLFSRLLPTRLDQKSQNEMLLAAKQAVQALGLTSSPVHVELILTRNGPKIIEIGARIGGYRARMYELSYGLNMYQAAIDTAFGKTVKFQSSFRESCAALELFAEETGYFDAIHSSEIINKLASIQYFSVKRSQGQPTGPAKFGYKAAAVIMLAHESKAQLQADIDAVRDQCRVAVLPNSTDQP